MQAFGLGGADLEVRFPRCGFLDWVGWRACECDRLLGSIEDSKLRNVAELKLHGYTNQEIAQMMGVAKRTVQNMLSEIKDKIRKRFGQGFAA